MVQDVATLRVKEEELKALLARLLEDKRELEIVAANAAGPKKATASKKVKIAAENIKSTKTSLARTVKRLAAAIALEPENPPEDLSPLTIHITGVMEGSGNTLDVDNTFPGDDNQTTQQGISGRPEAGVNADEPPILGLSDGDHPRVNTAVVSGAEQNIDNGLKRQASTTEQSSVQKKVRGKTAEMEVDSNNGGDAGARVEEEDVNNSGGVGGEMEVDSDNGGDAGARVEEEDVNNNGGFGGGEDQEEYGGDNDYESDEDDEDYQYDSGNEDDDDEEEEEEEEEEEDNNEEDEENDVNENTEDEQLGSLVHQVTEVVEKRRLWTSEEYHRSLADTYVNPYIIMQPKIPFQMRDLVRKDPEYLSDVVTRSYDLSMEFLMNNRRNYLCIHHVTQNRKPDSQEVNNLNRPTHIWGTAFPRRQNPNNKTHIPREPEHLHCGCHERIALAGLIMFKTWKVKALINGQLIEEGLQKPLSPRVVLFILQFLKANFGYTVDDMFTSSYDAEEEAERRAEVMKKVANFCANEYAQLTGKELVLDGIDEAPIYTREGEEWY